MLDHDGVVVDSFEIFSLVVRGGLPPRRPAADRDHRRRARPLRRQLLREHARRRAPTTRRSARPCAAPPTPCASPCRRSARSRSCRRCWPSSPRRATSSSSRRTPSDVVELFLRRHGIAGVAEVAGAEAGRSKVAKIEALIARFPGQADYWFVGDTAGDMREARLAGATAARGRLGLARQRTARGGRRGAHRGDAGRPAGHRRARTGRRLPRDRLTPAGAFSVAAGSARRPGCGRRSRGSRRHRGTPRCRPRPAARTWALSPPPSPMKARAFAPSSYSVTTRRPLRAGDAASHAAVDQALQRPPDERRDDGQLEDDQLRKLRAAKAAHRSTSGLGAAPVGAEEQRRRTQRVLGEAHALARQRDAGHGRKAASFERHRQRSCSPVTAARSSSSSSANSGSGRPCRSRPRAAGRAPDADAAARWRGRGRRERPPWLPPRPASSRCRRARSGAPRRGRSGRRRRCAG